MSEGRGIPTNVLDHIIHLSPPGELQAGIKRFEELGFKVLPGGEHADGLTSNALVVLSDGVYLELIAFTHDVDYYRSSASSPTSALLEKRQKHWWGYKTPGWIDWANLGFGGEEMADILSKTKSDGGPEEVVVDGGDGSVTVKYLAPIEGGRTKPDGDLLRWRVTFPDSAAHGRGALPFFCEDLTPRDRRVPLAKPDGSESSPQPSSGHRCKASGIAYILLSTGTSMDFTVICTQLSLVLGVRNPRISPDGKEARWTLKTPQESILPDTIITKPAPELILRTATPTTDPDLPISGSDKAWIDEVGFWVYDSSEGERGSGGGETVSNLGKVGGVAFVPLPQTTQ